MLAIKIHSRIQNVNSNLLIYPNETIIITLTQKTNNYTLEKCLSKRMGLVVLFLVGIQISACTML